jgi:hypothetical protein
MTPIGAAVKHSPTLATTLALAATFSACAHTKPGTHVEVVEESGEKIYVAGAAGPGMNQALACGAAVGRAVAAIAQRFCDDNDSIADDVADKVGASDGRPFLTGFAKADAEGAAVQDKQFDPVEHLCLATVRWKPPLFVKEAVLKYADEVKRAELERAAPAPKPAAPAPAPSAPSSAPPASPPVPVINCDKERRALDKARDATQRTLADFEECKRRTGGDENICHRYKLYKEEAEGKEGVAKSGLERCVEQPR